jgi:cytochrome subunit of sulfide dehydrogenase
VKMKFVIPALLALAASGQTVAQDDPYLARNLAATCANCHGTNGKSVGGMDSLAGESKEKLIQKMGEFKSGAKPATIMHQIAKGYTDEQIALIAGYFATKK